MKRTVIVLDSDTEDDETITKAVKKSKIEPVGWKPFYLTTVKGVSSVYNEGCLSFADLFTDEPSNRIDEICLMNYMIDLEWVIDQVPTILLCDKLLCLHGSEVDKMYAKDSWIISKVDMGIEKYGTHHSKLAIIFYTSGMRLVICTANFYAEDFDYRTQGIYIQDFPLKTNNTTTTSSSIAFEQELIEYLSRISATKKANERLAAIMSRITLYDFSSAEVKLIASVPGRHKENKEKWGIGKLHKELLQAGLLTPEYNAYHLVMQYSSIGSMGKDGKIIDEIAMRMIKPSLTIQSFVTNSNTSKSNGNSSMTVHYDPKKVELIWPTVECVRNSLQGYAAGNSLPGYEKCFYESHQLIKGFQGRLKQWIGTIESGRNRATPHMKCYFRYLPPIITISDDHDNNDDHDEIELAWFLLTSANLSQAALGVYQVKESQLYIKSYELGVLYIPSQCKTIGRRFSCTPNHALLGLSSYSSASESSTKFRVSIQKHSFMDKKNTNKQVMYFPIPFRLPPPNYRMDQDEPWIWDRSYFQPDCFHQIKP